MYYRLNVTMDPDTRVFDFVHLRSRKTITVAAEPDTGASITCLPADMAQGMKLMKYKGRARTMDSTELVVLGDCLMDIWCDENVARERVIFVKDLTTPLVSKEAQKFLGLVDKNYPHHDIAPQEKVDYPIAQAHASRKADLVNTTKLPSNILPPTTSTNRANHIAFDCVNVRSRKKISLMVLPDSGSNSTVFHEKEAAGMKLFDPQVTILTANNQPMDPVGACWMDLWFKGNVARERVLFLKETTTPLISKAAQITLGLLHKDYPRQELPPQEMEEWMLSAHAMRKADRARKANTLNLQLPKPCPKRCLAQPKAETPPDKWQKKKFKLFIRLF